MFEYLSLEAVGSWIVFFGYLYSHIQQSNNFQGSSRNYEIALMISSLVGSIALLYLLFNFYQHSNWYSPVILFSVGSFLSATIFALWERICGTLVMSISAFIFWPAGAYFFYRASESL
ncbi:hypothetical protein [Vibrio litoralis]|jgi:hypothetical protein|uniref:hypothetical protein n=1 Tax=Vibrio litoralis TaxID=335972 RepID=UPI0018686332|nr:hypothetical protein [Vibrio litoralis]